MGLYTTIINRGIPQLPHTCNFINDIVNILLCISFVHVRERTKSGSWKAKPFIFLIGKLYMHQCHYFILYPIIMGEGMSLNYSSFAFHNWRLLCNLNQNIIICLWLAQIQSNLNWDASQFKCKVDHKKLKFSHLHMHGFFFCSQTSRPR